MGYDLSVLTEAGLDIRAGTEYTGNEEKYISAVQRFCKNHEKNKARVEDFYSAKDYENYMITVHALKSNSRMIGAAELGSSFEELENAAREGNTDLIDKKTVAVIMAYDELVKKLSPILEMEDVKAADEISADEAKKVSADLLAALDDFDMDTSLSLANKLFGYPFRITQRDKLKEAIAFINDFMYDEAAEIISGISGEIE